MSRIFLVEEHAPFRQALAWVLGQQPDLEVVAQAGSLAECRDGAAEKLGEVDLAVVGLLLPDGSGIDCMRELREAEPNVSVLVLTIAQERELHARALEAGAREVITKAASLEEIIGAIRKLEAQANEGA